VVLQKANETDGESAVRPQSDRFDAARGKADVKWRTQDLMALLRG
jgi:antitoxin PrlF